MTTTAQSIIQQADDLYGKVESPVFYIYASVYRPMSGSWARIPGARFVNAERETGAHTWVVVPELLDKKTIESYELTPKPVYSVGEAQAQQEPCKAYEVRVSWDTTDFWYATDDLMDAFTRFAEVVKSAVGQGQVEVISTKSGKVMAAFSGEEEV